MDVQFRDDVTVSFENWQGDDNQIVHAMLVSTLGFESLDVDASYGRINFLMKNRHGTPFEHNSMTFYIEAPIFVFREFHRHRIGWSYNEMSGRYKELEPVFYVPSRERNLVQIGKPGHYEFVPGDSITYDLLNDAMRKSYKDSFEMYRDMLNGGIAKEVARMVLPVGIYSSMYATCNARSLMAFLSLRTKNETAMFPSYPMREIEMVAEKMESHFARHFPLTYQAFCENGRVCP